MISPTSLIGSYIMVVVVAVLLLDTGEVFTFGGNQYGQLGHGDTSIRWGQHLWQAVPVQDNTSDRPYLYRTTPLTGRTCTGQHLWQAVPVQDNTSDRPYLYRTTPLTGRTCTGQHLWQAVPVQDNTSDRPYLYSWTECRPLTSIPHCCWCAAWE